MKKIILTIFCFFVMVGVACAGSVGLEWSPLTDQTLGVRIYIGTISGTYTNSHDAGVASSTVTIDNLNTGTTYYFAAKAYDQNGNYADSFSNELSYTVPPETILPELPEITVNGVTITISVQEN